MAVEELTTTCCVAGGGPAGIMLGVLLARAGIDVVVLEKHADFLRDFRGDTIHPSTLELLGELGWLDGLLALPHRKARRLRVRSGDEEVVLADFSRLPTTARYIAFLPQWDFLDFLAAKGAAYQGFHLRMGAEVTELLSDDGQVTGVGARTPQGTLRVRAELVVAADGRSSTVRRLAGLPVRELGAPMDVLWFRLRRVPTDPSEPLGHFEPGQLFIMIDRGEVWQCGRVIAKGTVEQLRAEGMDAFRAEVAAMAPFVADRVDELRCWDDVKLLTVRVDRLATWYRSGVLCIGDAAHAMSPIGGVGINLAVQDAVAAANLLAGPLREGGVDTRDLHRVQRRRELPARLTQAFQVQAQNRALGPLLRGQVPSGLPLPLRLLGRFPALAHIPGRLLGLGVRPEHVRTPAAVGVRRPG
jgi:2-polyprenyl-6-methoxyphenol hydroxylase-like FAD-dependent oxidoreductase